MLGLLGSAMAGGAQAVSQVSEGRIEEKRAKALEKLRTMNNRAEGAIRFGQEQTLAETNFNNSQQLSEAESRRQDRRDELNRMSAKGLADTKFGHEKEIIALKLDEGGPGFGKVQPGDFTPESLQEYGRTKDFNDLVRYESAKSVNIGGVPHVFDPAFGGYRPASVMGGGPGGSNSEESAPVTAQAVGANEAQIAGMTEEAKAQAKNEAEQASPEAVKKRQDAISRSEEVLRVVDDLLSDDLSSVTGYMSQTRTLRPESKDLIARARRLESLLTAENLGLMSGVLTDRDMDIIKDIGSGLTVTENGIQMSEEGARTRLLEIQVKLKSGLAQQMDTDNSSSNEGGDSKSQGGSMSPDDADSYINQILGQ